MALYRQKFLSILLNLSNRASQTHVGERLGREFTITCDPDKIQEIYHSGEYTRSEVSRRMVEHNGAKDTMVSQTDERAEVKRKELVKYLGNKMYQNVLDSIWEDLDSRLSEAENTKTELYAVLRKSIAHGLLEPWLGIEHTPELKSGLSEIGFQKLHWEEKFEVLFILNVFKLPQWLKNIFSPGLKVKNEKFQQTVEYIYNHAIVKPGSWLERLKELEKSGVLTHSEVLGEIRAIYIGTSTMSSSLAWSIYYMSSVDFRNVDKCTDPIYSRYVYMEALRLNPPFHVLSYEHKNQSKCPFHFGKKVAVVSVLQTHTSPRNWEDPLKFDPTRFSKGLSKIKKGSYIPFGGGERACPGSAMSMYIAPKMISKIFSKYRFIQAEKPNIPDHNNFQSDDKGMKNTFFAKPLTFNPIK